MKFLVGRRGPPQNSSRSQRVRAMQLKKAVPPGLHNKQQGAEERLLRVVGQVDAPAL
jgi:hypothetical protein